MATFTYPRHGNIVGIRSEQALAEEPAAATRALQEAFTIALPAAVLQFMLDLSNCVLYYQFDAVTRTGKIKSYSHFVLTNVIPSFAEESYGAHQPASTIGFLRRFRGLGLPPHYLPFLFEFNKTLHLFCDLRPESAYRVLIAKSETAFDDSSWTPIAPSFEAFVAGLRVDFRQVASVLRICGGAVTPAYRQWLEEAIGENWETTVKAERARGKPKSK
jgi:hypothetical protein